MSNHSNSEHIRLKELGNSKFEVAKNEYDIRGWTVKNGQGRILGKVNDLLFDKESEKVLYMVLDLEGNEMHLKERKVLAPLSVAEIQEAYHNVTFPGVMANELTELPTYEKGRTSTRVEDIVQHAFAGLTGGFVQQQRSQYHENVSSDSRYRDNSSQRQVSDRGRPQTVVGVFEHSNQGQAAVEYLLDNQFKRNQIEISSRATEYREGEMNDEDHSVTNWFKSVFGNDDDARAYSEAAKTGCVVTVHTSSMDEAESAASIMDKHGAINIDESTDSKRSFKSRILDRRDANSRWER
ncbi:PRC-barrel domain-containing protein [Paradesertivirga mongoliensis]|uniref:PRC-barrel domain-containing protein n=1 Tax=Paradesertivirga mongoliensis TaxID=2100740 RepID=A0ABW4ZNU0_9SPHI|nr:PRC-barrel domain-containing protein [Pedobacter mongoliensis]